MSKLLDAIFYVSSTHYWYSQKPDRDRTTEDMEWCWEYDNADIFRASMVEYIEIGQCWRCFMNPNSQRLIEYVAKHQAEARALAKEKIKQSDELHARHRNSKTSPTDEDWERIDAPTKKFRERHNALMHGYISDIDYIVSEHTNDTRLHFRLQPSGFGMYEHLRDSKETVEQYSNVEGWSDVQPSDITHRILHIRKEATDENNKPMATATVAVDTNSFLGEFYASVRSGHSKIESTFDNAEDAILFCEEQLKNSEHTT